MSTETRITTDRDPRIDGAETTTTDVMTAVIIIAMTGTTIMLDMMTIAMTGMTDGTHALIGETATATHATIEDLMTTADGTLLKMTSATPTHLGTTHHQTRPRINNNSFHTQTERTPAARPT